MVIPIIPLKKSIAVADVAVQAAGLGQSGDAGLDLFAAAGIGDPLRKAQAVRRHIGPGAYEAHRTQEHIKKLRELVEV